MKKNLDSNFNNQQLSSQQQRSLEYFDFAGDAWERFQKDCKKLGEVDSLVDLISLLTDKIKDQIIRQKKVAVLSQLKEHGLLGKVSKEGLEKFIKEKDYRVRTVLFRELLNLELNKKDELSDDFFQKFNFLLSADDQLIVGKNFSNNKSITGLILVKSGRFEFRQLRSFRSFYHKVSELIDGLRGSEEGPNVFLDAFDSVDKMIFVPAPITTKSIEEIAKNKRESSRYGLTVCNSIFSSQDVDALLYFLANKFLEKEEK